MPSAEIISIGSELLLGQIVDTNATWMAQRLTEIGINLYRKTVVGDNKSRMYDVINQALDRSDVVICGGGLGPTQDDITREVIAEVTNRKLILDEELLNTIDTMFRSRGFLMTQNNERQAYIPADSIKIHNPNGTAPAFSLKWQNKIIYALPGVPHEMKWLFENVVLPELIQSFSIKTKIEYESLKVLGMGESTVDDKIGDLMKIDNPIVGLLAHPGQVDVRITATGEDGERKNLIEKTKKEILERLKDTTIISEDLTPIEYLQNLLIKLCY